MQYQAGKKERKAEDLRALRLATADGNIHMKRSEIGRENGSSIILVSTIESYSLYLLIIDDNENVSPYLYPSLYMLRLLLTPLLIVVVVVVMMYCLDHHVAILIFLSVIRSFSTLI